MSNMIHDFKYFDSVEIKGGDHDGQTGQFLGTFYGIYLKNEKTLYIQTHVVKPLKKTQRPTETPKIGGTKAGQLGEKVGQLGAKVYDMDDFELEKGDYVEIDGGCGKKTKTE